MSLLRRPFLLAFAAGVLLWTLISQLNHHLTPAYLSVFVGGLLITFSSLRLAHRDGWRAALLLGLWCDAAAPVHLNASGQLSIYTVLHTALFLVTHTLLFRVRARIPHQETFVAVVVALIANAFIFAALSLAYIVRNPVPLAAVPALTVHMFFSELVIALIAPWFFALQERLFEFAGVSLRREQRGLL